MRKITQKLGRSGSTEQIAYFSDEAPTGLLQVQRQDTSLKEFLCLENAIQDFISHNHSLYLIVD